MGLSAEAFWCLDDREFAALKQVHDKALMRWAIQQSTLYNGFGFKNDGIPWTAEDFLGGSQKRQKKLAKQKEEMEVRRANAVLNAMRPGMKPPAWLPEWAIGEYKGRLAQHG